ncbi:cellulose biosynthesis protein BcsQ [Telmatospirillum siberiense]|uniref:Cellulose synthase operon protein YhjQ n=1 Tax=Telmatospirillum siberiense TaxID=382514 RepID=A0A2N3PZD4_9PROT|nr:cellulose biosynthesis protein BcsQ [Telmatospirillum siberiense]PKU25745.1 cellulose synthase operon protein YhjQ [Telmatospirillum siberiense]
MPIVVVASAKGGVGKTTIAANLAVAFRSMGWEVLAVDLDPQNSLHLHFGLDLQEQGLGPSLMSKSDWRTALKDAPHGIQILPFGMMPERHLALTERLFRRRASEFVDYLGDLAKRPDHMVVVDTSPGQSSYCEKVLDVADLKLTVLLADAASFAVSGMHEEVVEERRAAGGRPLFGHYVINQYYPNRQLSRDVHAVFEQRFGKSNVNRVHVDQGVADALAYRQTVLFHDPRCRATQDILSLALAVDRLVDPHGEKTGASAGEVVR